MNVQWSAELDGEFYYFDICDDEKGLYKIDTEGKVTKLSDQKGFGLNAVGEHLYFFRSDESGEKSQIVKMKKDGSEEQVLLEGNMYIYLIMVDRRIYFSYKLEGEGYSHIYSMTTNGRDLRKTDLREDFTFQLLLNPRMRLRDMETEEHERLAEITTGGEEILWMGVSAGRILITFEKIDNYILNTDGTGLAKTSDLLGQIER